MVRSRGAAEAARGELCLQAGRAALFPRPPPTRRPTQTIPPPPHHGCSRLVRVLLHTMLLVSTPKLIVADSFLPTPRYSRPAAVHSDDEDDHSPAAKVSTALTTVVRPYGSRRGWKPTRQEEFGDGGAYPECHVAQYPLDLGRKKVRRTRLCLYSGFLLLSNQIVLAAIATSCIVERDTLRCRRLSLALRC